MGHLVGRLWVTGTLLLISFIGFSSQVYIIYPSYGSVLSRPLLELLVPFNFLLALLFVNYALCIVTDPGTVPDSWRPDATDTQAGVEVKRITGEPRYCRICQAYKPSRAHHCKQCQTCVLKMDHHCPWINNCVGHANHGHFIRFLFMVDVACTYHLWMITDRAFRSLDYLRVAPSTAQVVMLVLNYTACVPVIMLVGMFSLFHFWSLLTNTTTIEGWEKDKVATLKRRGKIMDYQYPYHLGYLANIKAVLGDNLVFWCWPTRKPPGDGLHYAVGAGIEPSAQYGWPPRDKYSSVEREATRAAAQRHHRLLLNVSNGSPAPFTYGSGFNPALLPSNTNTLRQRRQNQLKPYGSMRSPYHDEYEGPLEDMLTQQVYDDDTAGDEDETPLGMLVERRGPQIDDGYPSDDGDDISPPAIRVRRGSEGFEVRPRNFITSKEAGGASDGEDGTDFSWRNGSYSDSEPPVQRKQYPNVKDLPAENAHVFHHDKRRVKEMRYKPYVPDSSSEYSSDLSGDSDSLSSSD